jgi:ABC-2 type transport system permease protein
VTIPAITAVLVAGVLVNGVQLSAVSWAQLLVALVLGSLPFAAIGLLIGYLFDAGSAQGAMMITLFSLAILGGLWAPITSFPDTLATIGRKLPSFRLAELGRDAATGVLPDLGTVAILVAYAVVIGGLVVWRYRSIEATAHA